MGSIRHRPDRGRFQLDYVDADGIRRRPMCAAGTSEAQAKRQLRDIEAGVRSGLAPSTTHARETHSVSRVAAEWVKAHTSSWSPSTKASASGALKRYIFPALGKRAIEDLDRQEIEEFLSGLTPGAAAKTRQILVGLCQHAVRAGYVEEAPTKGVRLKRARTGPVRFLTRKEVEGAIEGCEGDIRDAIVLAVSTGLRAGELVALKPDDWQGETLLVQRAWDRIGKRIGPPKNGKARRVPVSADAAKVLRRRLGGEYIWTAGRAWSWFATDWRRVALAQGLPTGTHILRHTMASWWVQDGGSLQALQQILGHGDIRMVLVYAHLAPDTATLEAARLWGPLGTRQGPKSRDKRRKRANVSGQRPRLKLVK